MLIGMVTVFTILLIVIYGSKLLIAAINKFAPEQPKSPAKKTDDFVFRQFAEWGKAFDLCTNSTFDG